jgi:hypothetical protein
LPQSAPKSARLNDRLPERRISVLDQSQSAAGDQIRKPAALLRGVSCPRNWG